MLFVVLIVMSSLQGFCVPKEVFPCLMCAAAAKGDCGRLLSLMKKVCHRQKSALNVYTVYQTKM